MFDIFRHFFELNSLVSSLFDITAFQLQIFILLFKFFKSRDHLVPFFKVFLFKLQDFLLSFSQFFFSMIIFFLKVLFMISFSC